MRKGERDYQKGKGGCGGYGEWHSNLGGVRVGKGCKVMGEEGFVRASSTTLEC